MYIKMVPYSESFLYLDFNNVLIKNYKQKSILPQNLSYVLSNSVLDSC